ncbi:MAG: hypothetical protein JWQ53_1514 [Klenkia sp.]|nr:hypothetical protein [Klenkia sp.]
MPRPMTVPETVLVSAPPATVHVPVAGPTRTAERSPDSRGTFRVRAIGLPAPGLHHDLAGLEQLAEA